MASEACLSRQLERSTSGTARALTEFLQNAAENVGSFVDLSAVLPLYAAFHFRAQMAELVDALRSGRSVLMDVEVRVLFWYQLLFQISPICDVGRARA